MGHALVRSGRVVSVSSYAMAMYHGANMVIRTAYGNMEGFEVIY